MSRPEYFNHAAPLKSAGILADYRQIAADLRRIAPEVTEGGEVLARAAYALEGVAGPDWWCPMESYRLGWAAAVHGRPPIEDATGEYQVGYRDGSQWQDTNTGGIHGG